LSFTGNVFIFLGTVAALSVTGVMMPGPVTAAAIAKGYRHKWAGVHIAVGHAIVEFPTIALMALGFSAVLRDTGVSIVIGILGGAMLLFMGVSMILSRGGVVEKLKKDSRPLNKSSNAKHDEKKTDGKDPFPYHPLLVGVMTTASNPYYFLWWATLGAALTLNALEFGLAVLVVMAVVHWSIDLGWDTILSYSVHRSRHLWNDKVYAAIFAFCGGVMVFFGLWFAGSAVVSALSLL